MSKVRRLAEPVGVEVPLARHENVVLVGVRQIARLDDDRAVHAVRDVHQDGLGAAVVHEDAGVVRAKRVADRLARKDVDEVLVGGDARRVEVHRVGDRATVGERHVHELSLPDVDHRARRTTGPRPGGVLDAGCDVDRDVLEHEVHVGDRTGGGGRQRGGECLVRHRLRHRVFGCGTCIARQGAHRHRRGGNSRGGVVRRAAVVAGVGPHQNGDDAEHTDEQTQQHGRDGDERERVGVRAWGVACHRVLLGFQQVIATLVTSAPSGIPINPHAVAETPQAQRSSVSTSRPSGPSSRAACACQA